MCELAGEFQAAMTIEDCCLNNPDGFSFTGSNGTCGSCIGILYVQDSTHVK